MEVVDQVLVVCEGMHGFDMTERDAKGMLIDYTATLSWDIDLIETIFAGQARGSFSSADKARMAEGMSLWVGQATMQGAGSGQWMQRAAST